MKTEITINHINEPKYFRMMPEKREELVNRLLDRHWRHSHKKRARAKAKHKGIDDSVKI